MSGETPVEKMTYEEAFSALENVVTALEIEQHPLDQILALYERGQRLAQRCTELLDKAELQVRQITQDGLVPFDPTA